MDEKGCRLTLHHQQTVIAQKGIKRVHMLGSEHGENVTVVGCVNAIGNPIPPMILFKGKRKKPEFDDNLPPGSIVHMAPKGSMTTELFTVFIEHLAKYKTLKNASSSLTVPNVIWIFVLRKQLKHMTLCFTAYHPIRHMNYSLLTKLVTNLLNHTGIKKFCNICTKHMPNTSQNLDLT